MTAYELTDKGCALVAEYVGQVREIVGLDIPLAFDHFGYLGINSLIKLGRALQKYNPAWLEDMVPWYRTEEWKTITDALDVPTLTAQGANRLFMDLDAHAGLHRDVDVTVFHQGRCVGYVFVPGHLRLVPFIGDKVFGGGDGLCRLPAVLVRQTA